MKKLLLGSALFAISSVGMTGVATAEAKDGFGADQFEQALQALNITSDAIDMYHGDIQATSRTVTTELYTGFGSSAMGTIRAFRF